MFYRSSSIVKGQMLLSKVNSDLTANLNYIKNLFIHYFLSIENEHNA